MSASFHILGFGSIGSLVSFYLRAALPKKVPIVVLHRSKDAADDALKNPRVTLRRDGAESVSAPLLHESFARYKAFTHLASSNLRNLDGSTRNVKAENRWRRLLGRPGAKHPYGIQTLIVTTKAHQVHFAMQTLRPRLSADSTIVLLNNGMGVYEMLIEKFFPDPATRPQFVLSVNTHGAFRDRPGHVVHAGVGQIKLAIVPDPRGRDYEQSLQLSGLDVHGALSLSDIWQPSEDKPESGYHTLYKTISALTRTVGLSASWNRLHEVQMAMRRKLVVNAAINPVTALIGCKNGELVERPDGQFLINLVCREASAIFRAQWEAEAQAASLLSSQEERSSILEMRFPTQLQSRALAAECEAVARGTAQNRSSMLVDVLKGARYTEIDYITGYLLALAKKYDVRAPAIAALHNLIGLRAAIPLQSSKFKFAFSNTTK